MIRLFASTWLVLCVACCTPTNEPGSAQMRVSPVEQKLTPSEQAPPNVAKSGPAGIVLYCRHRGEIHLLLANDRLGRRGWGGFVGGDKEGEDTAMTAARETSEETRGFYKTDWLLKKIENQKPVTQWGCSFYFAEVTHVPAQSIMDHPIPLLNLAYMETQHYAWVPFSEIAPLLTKQSLKAADLRLHPRHLQTNSRSDSFWQTWIDNMRRLHQQGGFPWER